MISRSCSVQSILLVATALFGIAVATAEDDPKVSIELYYESQCPGCREMITTSFKDAFQTDGFLDMADVTFVPYGNARESATPSGGFEFECQHGPSECTYNIIEACALAKIDDPKMAFSFIDCIERSDESRDPDQDFFSVALECGMEAKLSKETINAGIQCSTGLEGNQLEHEAAQKTDSLDPPHQFVPYVVVNGVHDDGVQDSISESLFDYVCENYSGPNKSKECKATVSGLRASASSSSRVRVSLDESKKVCFRQKETSVTSSVETSMVTEE